MTENTQNAAIGKICKQNDIDNGYAWVVLLGSFLMYLLVSGSIKAYGVLYTEMVEYYSTGYGNTAWIGGIASLLLLILGPVANLLSRRFSFRLITFIGGALLGLGYILSGFVTRMEFMYLTFLCCGFGYGLSFSPCATIVSFYFDKRRALANGITVSGSGVGALTLPFLYNFLIDTYGLKGTLWIIGAILCNSCVAACLFRQPSLIVTERQTRKQSEQVNAKNKARTTEVQKRHCQIFPRIDMKFSLFKNPIFTINVMSFVISTFAYMGIFTVLPAHVKALGYNKTYEALSVTIVGGVEVFARIFIGWFVDLKIIKPKYIYSACMFIGAIISFLVPLFDTFTFMAVYAGIVSMFPGSFLSLISVMIIDVVGLELLPAAFGLISFSMAFGATISQPGLGFIKDYFGSWNPAFMVIGGTFLIAGMVVLTEPVIVRFRRKQKNIYRL